MKTYANHKGIEIIGDMPIYVSADSVEVWTMPELFKVDSDKKPLFIAGVPADGFSEDGQLWGNPTYNWSAHEKSNFAWWIYRIQESFKLYDQLRIDHFKGFSDFWEIPAGDKTARNGHWASAPGIALFSAVREALESFLSSQKTLVILMKSRAAISINRLSWHEDIRIWFI